MSKPQSAPTTLHSRYKTLDGTIVPLCRSKKGLTTGVPYKVSCKNCLKLLLVRQNRLARS